MPDTATILDQLNDYSGDNIWQDIIGGLDLDDDATDEVEHGRSDAFVLTDGRGFTYIAQDREWVEA